MGGNEMKLEFDKWNEFLYYVKKDNKRIGDLYEGSLYIDSQVYGGDVNLEVVLEVQELEQIVAKLKELNGESV